MFKFFHYILYFTFSELNLVGLALDLILRSPNPASMKKQVDSDDGGDEDEEWR